MYQYDDYDRALVKERVAQFRDQVARYQAEELSEEEFLPLRLQNGLYLQKHAYMLRVAIPYGVLSTKQLRALADIGDRYDKGYGHFTTRQNIQYNWVKLSEVPDILAYLAEHYMHAIQTSGNVVRNVTTEAFAGVAEDEVYDPRIFAEIIRQWSTINPEFLFLPRKFKIAVSATEEDRAAVRIHDVGLYLHRDESGALYFKVMVGGGLGRTPYISQLLNDRLPWCDLLSYLEAILRVFNRYGRRDSKYKARIKILVSTLGIDAFKQEVEQEFQQIAKEPNRLTDSELSRIASQFLPAVYQQLDETDLGFATHLQNNEAFSNWYNLNVRKHKVSGYRSVVISTKFPNNIPGDVTSEQMRGIADLAERFGFGEVRVTHEQNLVLPDVPKTTLFQVWMQLNELGLGVSNHTLLSDMIVCPGASYCNLATAHSFPVAEQVVQAFTLEEQQDIGPVSMNLSGCINSCAHHHIANIGMLGLNKSQTDHYQITLGGRQGTQSRLGKVLGPAIAESELPQAIRMLFDVYRRHREVKESFIQVVDRIGLAPFKDALYQEKSV